MTIHTKMIMRMKYRRELLEGIADEERTQELIYEDIITLADIIMESIKYYNDGNH